MVDDKEQMLTKILSLESLRLPKTPRVVEIRHKLGRDWSGDEAVWIWLILDDETRAKDWDFRRLKPLIERVEEAVARSPLEVWPYVAVRSKSEQDEMDAEAVRP
jgi:hypothetical protein